jgi:phosphonate transport system substrate-binding protein
MKKHLGFIVLCVWSLLLLVPSTGMVQEKGSYTIAVVPQTQISDIYERWAPFLKRLSQEVGAEIKIAPYNTIRQFDADLQKGVPDFAYMNPYQEFIAKESQGYIPLVRDNADLFGILVVNKSGTINSVKDLEGKELVFPSHAFAANQYMRALLTDKEKIRFKSQFVTSHGSVYRAVKLNTAAGGGGIMKTFEKEGDDIKGHLKIIYETPKTASHPIAAHPRVPESIRKKVTQAIMNYAKEPSGKEMLKKIQIPEPVIADYQKDYAPLKKMEAMLKKYEETE